MFNAVWRDVCFFFFTGSSRWTRKTSPAPRPRPCSSGTMSLLSRTLATPAWYQQFPTHNNMRINYSISLPSHCHWLVHRDLWRWSELWFVNFILLMMRVGLGCWLAGRITRWEASSCDQLPPTVREQESVSWRGEADQSSRWMGVFSLPEFHSYLLNYRSSSFVKIMFT